MGLFDFIYQIGKIPAYFFGSQPSPQVPTPIILPSPTPIINQPTPTITPTPQQEQGAILNKPAPSILESARTVISAGTTPISANKPFVTNFETQFKNVGIGVANVFNYAAAKGYASIEGSPTLNLIGEKHPVFAGSIKTVAEGTLGIGLAIPRGLVEMELIPGTILSHAGTGKLSESDITAATSFGTGLVLPSIFKGASAITRPIGTAVVESGSSFLAKPVGMGIKYVPELVGGGMLAGYGANVQQRIFAPSLGDTTKVFQSATIQEKADYAKTHPGMELTGFDVTTQGARSPTFMEKYERLSNILGTEVFPMGLGAKFNKPVVDFGVKVVKTASDVATFFKEGVVIKVPASFVNQFNYHNLIPADILIVRPGRAPDVRLGQIEKPKLKRTTTQLQQLERPKVTEEETTPYISRLEMESTLSKLKAQKAELQQEPVIWSHRDWLKSQISKQEYTRAIPRVVSKTVLTQPHSNVIPIRPKPTETFSNWLQRKEQEAKTEPILKPKLEPTQITKTTAIQKPKMQMLLDISPLAFLKTKAVAIPKMLQSQKEIATPISIFKQASKQQPIQIPISKALQGSKQKPKKMITPFTKPVTITQAKTISTPVTRLREPKQELRQEPRTIGLFRPKATTKTIPITLTIPRIKTPLKPESAKKKFGGKRGFYGYGEFAKIATVNEMFRG